MVARLVPVHLGRILEILRSELKFPQYIPSTQEVLSIHQPEYFLFQSQHFTFCLFIDMLNYIVVNAVVSLA